MPGRRRLISLLAAAAVVVAALPGAAGAQQAPGPQPGMAQGLCPRVYPPDTNCYSIAYPGEIWATATTLPIKEGAEEVYDSLIPAPFTPPADGRREIGVLLFRLDVAVQPNRTIDSDPGNGYTEGSVAIRVGFPAEDGYPYDTGWWVIAQPLNDSGQYGSGRGIGLPKYMAQASLRISGGEWTAQATDWKDTGQAGGPGRTVVPGGNVLRIDWEPGDPEVSEERAQQLWTWGQYGEALFVQNRPYDETGSKNPGMVKFTPVSLIPIYGMPVYTPLTAAPDPRIGVATVTLEGEIPVHKIQFSELIDPGPHVVPGTSAFTRGLAFVTTDDLSDNQA